jgi:transglutaminase-like putative cysteine protease
VTAASRAVALVLLPLAVGCAGLRLLPVPTALAWTLGALLAGRAAVAFLARDPRGPLLPRRLRLVAWTLASAAVVAPSVAGGRMSPAGAAVVTGTLLEALWLLGPSTASTTTLLLLASALQTVAVAVGRPDAAGLAQVVAYAASLLAALVAIERAAGADAGAPGVRGLRRIDATPHAAARARTLAAAVAFLVVAGFLAGSAVYVVAVPLREAAVRTAADPAMREGSGVASRLGERGGGVTGTRVGARLGFVSNVKRDTRPALALRFRDGDGSDGAAPVYLRTATYETFTGREWRSAARRAVVHTDAGDGREDGWVALRESPPAEPPPGERRTRIRDLLGGPHLHLLPEAVAVRFDTGAAADRARLDRNVWKADPPLEPGDAYEVRSRTQRPTARELATAVGDPGARLAPVDHARIRDLAREVVGGETGVAARADLLAEELRSGYAYALDTRTADPARPVEEFLFRTRRGTCEHFASALVLLLRSLGHPARLAVGYRVPPDAWIPSWGEYVVRSSHAHAWVEVALRGHGWVRWDPTPPDRLAVDARPDEADLGADDEPGAPGLAERVLRLRAEDRDALLGRVRDAVAKPEVLVPVGLLVLGLLAAVRRRRARAAAGDVFGGVMGPALAPYRRAVRALEREGLRRRPSETSSEHWALAARRLPALAPAFGRLTRAFEGERYGARPSDPLAGAADADEVVACLRARHGRGADGG